MIEMDAGKIKLLAAFTYASDYTDFPAVAKMLAATPKYKPGMWTGKFVTRFFSKQVRADPYWLGDKAQPAGNVIGKSPITGIEVETIQVDAVPDYLAEGKVTDGSDYLIQGNPTGGVPKTVWHFEDNNMPTEFLAEYEDCYCDEAEFSTKLFTLEEGAEIVCLVAKLSFTARREYLTGVVQTTYEPIFRGDTSPVNPYIINGNGLVTCTWNSKTLGKYLSNISWRVKNHWGVMMEEDGNSYGNSVQNGGKQEFMTIAVQFTQVNETTDLDDLEQYLDGTTSSDLVFKVTRRHADDYLQRTFKNVKLLRFDRISAYESEKKPGIIQAVFSVPTDIEVVHKCTTAAGASAKAAAATYEL
jgi:hypothetical protein